MATIQIQVNDVMKYTTNFRRNIIKFFVSLLPYYLKTDAKF